MKRSLFSATLIIIAAHLFGARVIAAPSFDHLEPTHLGGYPKYRKLLIAKLGVTPFDYGRSILLPFGEPEASQSIYSKSTKDRRTYFVTRVSSERDLWDLTEGGRYPERAASVRIDRIDIEIPARTAELLRQVWLGMLDGPQKPRPTPSPSPPKRGAAAKSEERFVLMDPSFLEFSISRSDNAPLVGVLNVSAGYGGTKKTTLPRVRHDTSGFGDRVRMLAELSESVYQYCIARPGDRPLIANQIEQKASQLLEMLGKS